MSAFFFGRSEQQLFGFHHAPRGSVTGAVVLCPSWGSEYVYAHRALRVLAKRLAEHGRHVLRFDYSGEGDSWGDGLDSDVDRWIEDANSAVEELRAISSVALVDVVGLRIGACVAANAATHTSVNRLVLWDPVLDGREWAEQISPGYARVSDPSLPTCEFAKKVVSPRLVQQFVNIRAGSYPVPDGTPLLVLQSKDSGSTLPAELRQHALVEHRVIDDVLPWREDASVWNGLVPATSVGAIVEWLESA